MILSGGWCKEEQGAPCQAWQSLEGPLEVLPWSSGAQHLLSRSLGLYCPEKAQGPGNWAPGRQRWGCRKQSGQCRLRPGQGEGGQMVWLQASEWAAARMPMVGVPKEPPTCLPTSVQPREREEGPAAPPLPWGLEAGPVLGWATPWGVRGVGAGEASLGRGLEGREDSSQQQGPVPTGQRALPPSPHPPALTPASSAGAGPTGQQAGLGGGPRG